jgi:hypothetical protein
LALTDDHTFMATPRADKGFAYAFLS